jgi:hypothetical protein
MPLVRPDSMMQRGIPARWTMETYRHTTWGSEEVGCFDILAAVVAVLQREGRLTYWALALQGQGAEGIAAIRQG